MNIMITYPQSKVLSLRIGKAIKNCQNLKFKPVGAKPDFLMPSLIWSQFSMMIMVDGKTKCCMRMVIVP